jgi:hypothetical protein
MEMWDRLTKELSQSSPLDLLVKLLAALILLGIAYVSKRLWSLVWLRWTRRKPVFGGRCHRAQTAVGR